MELQKIITIIIIIAKISIMIVVHPSIVRNGTFQWILLVHTSWNVNSSQPNI